MAALILALGCQRPLACGPDFPNNLISGGDDALLVAPVADFSRELARLKLPAGFHAVTNEVGHASQTAELDLKDLAAALKESGLPDEPAQSVLASHRVEREKLQAYLDALAEWNSDRPWTFDEDTGNTIRGEPTAPPPAFPDIFAAGGLPDEFADYFEGAMAVAKPDGAGKAAARAAWERLLNLPAKERRYKSTWAAFMLGKSWAEEDPDKSLAYFRQVRSLARQGCLDSAGLAAASLGEEARVDLKLGKLEEALDLYVQQYPTGDPTAASSLRIVSSKAVNTADDETLSRLAGNPVIQPVITAYLISSHLLESESQVETNVTQRWLAAVESADVRDVASAEKLALAAYQAGDWEGAQRWINRARATPVAQWLQAKLFLRAGKTDAAAGLLAKVAAQFPPDQPPTNPPAQLFDNLSLAGWTYTQHSVHAAAQVSGELGVFHLARRDYTEALDVLMRAGFWEDAAYIAEQVLTADELKNYVARNWADSKDVNTNADDPGAWWAVRDLRVEIRGLLARRLARLNRPAEAREFFGPELQKDYDALVQGMAKGADVSLSVGERAEAWFAAAKMTRAEGMDLFGTELDPDGHLFGGSFDLGVAVSNRTNESTTLLRASEDELRRASAPPADPNERYHYRFVAAAMGWQAALLMPDNSDATARVLCESGSWIKYLDPNRADVFYKSLVRRCRKTAIGDQADKMRWFPVLDADGKPIPWTPQPKMEVPVIDVPDVESLGNETE